jgi:menaquinone-dependent protoporphyrinogen oxidase
MATRELNVLVTAATRHGSTGQIAEEIGQELASRGIHAEVRPPEEVTDVSGYDAVIIGSAVYVGHWLQPAMDLVGRSRVDLTNRPVWLFTSGPVGKPAGKLTQSMDTDPVEMPELRAATYPRGHKIFAGRLDPKSLPLMQRASVRLFRGMAGDFRDWGEIRQWADEIAGQLQADPRADQPADLAVPGTGARSAATP